MGGTPPYTVVFTYNEMEIPLLSDFKIRITEPGKYVVVATDSSVPVQTALRIINVEFYNPFHSDFSLCINDDHANCGDVVVSQVSLADIAATIAVSGIKEPRVIYDLEVNNVIVKHGDVKLKHQHKHKHEHEHEHECGHEHEHEHVHDKFVGHIEFGLVSIQRGPNPVNIILSDIMKL